MDLEALAQSCRHTTETSIGSRTSLTAIIDDSGVVAGAKLEAMLTLASPSVVTARSCNNCCSDCSKRPWLTSRLPHSRLVNMLGLSCWIQAYQHTSHHFMHTGAVVMTNSARWAPSLVAYSVSSSRLVPRSELEVGATNTQHRRASLNTY